MKIRIEGSAEELDRAKVFYESLQVQGMVKINSWSKPYPNRKRVDRIRILSALEKFTFAINNL
jgi:hypothetical protein